jgi:Bacterial hydrolase
MQTNETPFYDQADNPTGCCPRFKPEGWDDQSLHFEDKLFVRAKTRSLMHIPINMGSVFNKTFDAILQSQANDDEHAIVLSRDMSPWSAEHLFAVTKDVPDQKMVQLSGEYQTKVFEGPYRKAARWMKDFEEELEDEGLEPDEIYAFYTTCPKCAKVYGKNYVVMVAQVEQRDA